MIVMDSSNEKDCDFTISFFIEKCKKQSNVYIRQNSPPKDEEEQEFLESA